ncbi:MAG: LamG-like jellyroll fold domain-containing protein [Verrucomicrobiota bacterium]
MNEKEKKEFCLFCDAFIDGTIGFEDKQALEERLLESEEARLIYLERSELHSSLMHYASESENVVEPKHIWPVFGVDDAATEPPRAWHHYAKSAVKWAAALVIGFLLGSIFLWNVNPSGSTVAQSGSGEPEVIESTDEGIAVLIQAYQVDWGNGNTVYEPGDSIPVGNFRMEAGVAQLEFYSGASMILEGKADLEINSPDEVFCHFGKMSVQVSPHARGFVISTPDHRFVDLGTEFGLTIEPGTPSELHVFSGEVEVYGPGEDAGKPLKTLITGDAASLSADSDANDIDLNVDGYWDLKRLVEQTHRLESERFYAWKDYSKHVAESPGLVSYFPFYQTEPWVRRLENAVEITDENSHGAIVGSQWEYGRWPEKSALRFNNPSDRVRFNIPGEYESLTFATWVKIESLKNVYNGLFMTDSFEPGNPHWQITNQGRLQMGICRKPDENAKWGQYVFLTPPVIQPSVYGQWIHLASTFDGKTTQIRHYINGELVAESKQAGPSNTKLIIGSGELGNWGLPRENKSKAVRNFDGAMDEMIFYSRVLDEAEIAELYEMGRPMPLVTSSAF